MWRGGTQVQGVSIMERKSRRKGNACDKTTKDVPTEGASIPCKEKGTGRRKIVEEDRGRRGSMYDQATRSTARMEEEFNRRVKKEGRGALQKRYPRRGMTIRIGIVHKGNNSDICRV